MIRKHVLFWLLVVGVGMSATSVQADEYPDDDVRKTRTSELDQIRQEIKQLKRRSNSLEAQRETMIRREVNSYLTGVSAHGGASGANGFKGVTVQARFTSVAQATLGADPFNRHQVTGDVDLDFNFEVTDNLDLFLKMTANTASSSSSSSVVGVGPTGVGGGGFPAEFGAISGTFPGTLSGAADGIGVNGAVSTSPGSVRMHEAGVRWTTAINEHTLTILMGKLDPRDRIAQNRFAGDENTQFLNNLFDDPPAITWPTNASGRTVFGLHAWSNFGNREQYRLDIGWYNQPGQFFNKGILLWQFAWSGTLRGREITVRVYGQIDTAPNDISASGGVSADWWATDKIGVFARITVHDNLSPADGGVNHIESDWQAGAVFVGLIPDRPDDELGIAIGFIKGPVGAFTGASSPENHELVIELYYRFLVEEGKLQITPMVQFISDPGGGNFTEPDSLVLLGLRMHVPF